jgi:hypothetical protein
MVITAVPTPLSVGTPTLTALKVGTAKVPVKEPLA